MTDNVTKIRCIEIDNEMSVEWWYQNEQWTIFKIYFLVQCSITWTIYFYCIVQKTTVIFMWRFCGSCINATIYQTSQFFIFLLNIIRCCCWLQTQKTSKYVFRSITIFSGKMKIIVTEKDIAQVIYCTIQMWRILKLHIQMCCLRESLICKWKTKFFDDTSNTCYSFQIVYVLCCY